MVVNRCVLEWVFSQKKEKIFLQPRVITQLLKTVYENAYKDFIWKYIYSETLPYGHLSNAVTSLWPPGKMAIHFLVKKPSLIWSPVSTAKFFLPFCLSLQHQSWVHDMSFIALPLLAKHFSLCRHQHLWQP